MLALLIAVRLRAQNPPGAYVAENLHDHPIRILEIDLKGGSVGPA
jgi:hypothetical protein